jgi:non-canonical purine NTP pyrophosphatase (RdgB/HAM1 family)
MDEIAICTGNAGKRAEFERIMQRPLSAVSIELDEIQEIDTEAVCRAKAAQAFSVLQRPIIVDDTGFELEALNGFPGALVAWVLHASGPEILHRMLPDHSVTTAIAVTAIGFADASGIRTFVGRVSGAVLPTARGTNGFGFDPVFVPSGSVRTFAEMDDEEKDGLSPRGAALAQLSKWLDAR